MIKWNVRGHDLFWLPRMSPSTPSTSDLRRQLWSDELFCSCIRLDWLWYSNLPPQLVLAHPQSLVSYFCLRRGCPRILCFDLVGEQPILHIPSIRRCRACHQRTRLQVRWDDDDEIFTFLPSSCIEVYWSHILVQIILTWCRWPRARNTAEWQHSRRSRDQWTCRRATGRAAKWWKYSGRPRRRRDSGGECLPAHHKTTTCSGMFTLFQHFSRFTPTILLPTASSLLQ